jgi:hypothetical protein
VRFVPMLVVIAVIEAFAAARLPVQPGMALWNLDIPKIDAPLAVFMSEALHHGRLPLWDDRLGLGFPLYAEGQIGAFYPPNWILFQLAPLDALAASRVVHVAAAGVGAGVLAIRVAGSRTGAVVATSVVVLGGAIVTKLEWTNLVAAYAWLPWVLIPLARRPVPTRAGLVVAGCAWGIQALAGHPNTWLLTGVSAAVLLFMTRRDAGLLGRLVVFGGLGAGIGAIQLLPTLLLTTLSVRSVGLSADDVFTSAATPFDALSFGFAQPFIRTGPDGWDIFTNWYPDGIFALLEASAFVGLAAIALAAVGLSTRRSRRWIAVGLVMLAIPVVAAFRPAQWLAIPLLNGLRSPVRSYIVVTFVIGMLAAIGIARARHAPSPWSNRRAGVAVGVMVAAYGATLAAAAFFPDAFKAVLAASSSGISPDLAEQRRQFAVAALSAPIPVALEIAAGVAAVGLIAGRLNQLKASARSIGMAALVVVPLAVLSPVANVVRPAGDAWLQDSELATALRDLGPRRVLTLGAPGFYPGAPDRLAAAGVPDLEMFSSLNLLASDRIVDQARNGPDADLVRRLIGVDVLVTFGRPCPGTDARQLQEDQAAVCRVPAMAAPYWVPSAAVSAADDPGSPIRPRDATIDLAAAASGAVPGELITDEPGELAVRVVAPGSGYVWVDRAWWPGWRIDVDGTSATALRGLAGQLVPVTAGSHVITLHLVPWDALMGAAFAGLVLAAALIWLRHGRPGPGTLSPASPTVGG